jgi:WD40 repeat protein
VINQYEGRQQGRNPTFRRPSSGGNLAGMNTSSASSTSTSNVPPPSQQQQQQLQTVVPLAGDQRDFLNPTAALSLQRRIYALDLPPLPPPMGTLTKASNAGGDAAGGSAGQQQQQQQGASTTSADGTATPASSSSSSAPTTTTTIIAHAVRVAVGMSNPESSSSVACGVGGGGFGMPLDNAAPPGVCLTLDEAPRPACDEVVMMSGSSAATTSTSSSGVLSSAGRTSFSGIAPSAAGSSKGFPVAGVSFATALVPTATGNSADGSTTDEQQEASLQAAAQAEGYEFVPSPSASAATNAAQAKGVARAATGGGSGGNRPLPGSAAARRMGAVPAPAVPDTTAAARLSTTSHAGIPTVAASAVVPGTLPLPKGEDIVRPLDVGDGSGYIGSSRVSFLGVERGWRDGVGVGPAPGAPLIATGGILFDGQAPITATVDTSLAAAAAASSSTTSDGLPRATNIVGASASSTSAIAAAAAGMAAGGSSLPTGVSLPDGFAGNAGTPAVTRSGGSGATNPALVLGTGGALKGTADTDPSWLLKGAPPSASSQGSGGIAGVFGSLFGGSSSSSAAAGGGAADSSSGAGAAGGSWGSNGDGSWGSRPRGLLLNTLSEHTAGVNAISTCGDHSFFVTASDDGTVKVWASKGLDRDVTPASVLTYTSHIEESVFGDVSRGLRPGRNRVTDAVVCDNSSSVASASSAGSVHVWRVDLAAARIAQRNNAALVMSGGGGGSGGLSSAGAAEGSATAASLDLITSPYDGTTISAVAGDYAARKGLHGSYVAGTSSLHRAMAKAAAGAEGETDSSSNSSTDDRLVQALSKALAAANGNRATPSSASSGATSLALPSSVARTPIHTPEGTALIRRMVFDASEGSCMAVRHYQNALQSVLVSAMSSGVLHGTDLRARKEAWVGRIPSVFGNITAMEVCPGSTSVVVGTDRGCLCLYDYRFETVISAWRHSSRSPIRALYPYVTVDVRPYASAHHAANAAGIVSYASSDIHGGGDSGAGSSSSTGGVFGSGAFAYGYPFPGARCGSAAAINDPLAPSVPIARQLAVGMACGEDELSFWNLETGHCYRLLRNLPRAVASADAYRIPYLSRIEVVGNNAVVSAASMANLNSEGNGSRRSKKRHHNDNLTAELMARSKNHPFAAASREALTFAPTSNRCVRALLCPLPTSLVSSVIGLGLGMASGGVGGGNNPGTSGDGGGHVGGDAGSQAALNAAAAAAVTSSAGGGVAGAAGGSGGGVGSSSSQAAVAAAAAAGVGFVLGGLRGAGAARRRDNPFALAYRLADGSSGDILTGSLNDLHRSGGGNNTAYSAAGAPLAYLHGGTPLEGLPVWMLTAGTDRKVRCWDLERPRASHTVCGLVPGETREAYEGAWLYPPAPPASMSTSSAYVGGGGSGRRTSALGRHHHINEDGSFSEGDDDEEDDEAEDDEDDDGDEENSAGEDEADDAVVRAVRKALGLGGSNEGNDEDEDDEEDGSSALRSNAHFVHARDLVGHDGLSQSQKGGLRGRAGRRGHKTTSSSATNYPYSWQYPQPVRAIFSQDAHDPSQDMRATNNNGGDGNPAVQLKGPIPASTGHEAFITALAWLDLPTRLLLTGSSDGVVKVWR